MKFSPASALAVWAVGTGWLMLYILLERMDPYWGVEPVDWIQAGSAIVVLALYPLFRKFFAGWLARGR